MGRKIMTTDNAMRQAVMTAEYYLLKAVAAVNSEMPDSNNKEVIIAAFIKACSDDYNSQIMNGVVDDEF